MRASHAALLLCASAALLFAQGAVAAEAAAQDAKAAAQAQGLFKGKNVLLFISDQVCTPQGSVMGGPRGGGGAGVDERG